MSKEVDEKVVSMKFDHKNFMDNTAETMTRLDKLKSSLRLPGAAKGLEEVNKAASNTKLSPLETAAEQVGLKFNALQIMATTALMNITNTAVNAGKRIVSALTIDPVKMGFQEYETQINAVQTILANTESKGTTLDDVNKALDELNTYADKTIYNFTEMTRNIGTFTAAGIDLDTSVNAIQGIANLAAVSGSTSQQASTAMYQLSQALSSGTVRLMDWNSVVNAGMGGQVFQDALKETARVHGVAIDDIIDKNGSFRDSLKEEWLTSEILTETLQKFTMATEGLTEEQIEQNRAMLKSKGYTDEQIEGIFKLGNTATNAATKVKTFTQLMDTLKESAQSGWTQTWELIVGDFEESKKLWSSLSDYFGGMISNAAEARNKMLKGWADGGGREMMIESFKNIGKIIGSVVGPIREAFRDIFPKTTADRLLKITEAIKNFTSKLILSEKAQEKLKSAFKGFFAVIDIVLTAIKEVVKGAAKLIGCFADLAGSVLGISGSFGEWISDIRDTVKETGIFGTIIGGTVKILEKFIDALKRVISFLKEKFVAPGFEEFLSVLSGIWTVIKFVADKIMQVFSTLGKGMLTAFRSGDIKSAVDIFNVGIVGGILLNIKKFTQGISDTIGTFGGLTDIAGSVSGVLDSVKGCFQAWQQDIQANTLKKIATAIAILAVAILLIASIDPTRLSASLGAVTVLFADLMVSMNGMTSLGGPIKGAVRTMGLMMAMSISILILASALKKISSLDSGQLTIGLVGIFGMMAMLIDAINTIQYNMGDDKVAKVAGQLIGMAIALDLLVIAVKALAKMELVSLAQGVGGVAVMLGVLVGAMAVMSKIDSKKGAGQFIAMAIALDLLTIAIAAIGNMDLENIAKGVGALTVVIFALVAASAMMSGLMAGAGAMVLLSVAMGIFAIALTSMIPAFLAFSLIDMNAVCVGLLKLAGTLTIFSLAAVVAPLLLLVAIGLKALGAGLTALIPGLLAITLLDFAGLCGSLLKFAGTLLLLSLTAVVAPLLLLLGAGLLAIGVGATLAGPGLLLLAVGLTAFAAALAASLNIIIQGITAIITSIIGLIPSIIEAIGNGIILICKTIAGSIGAITDALSAVIIAVCDALILAMPKLKELICKLLDALLEIIVAYTPKIVEAGMKVIISFLDGIAQNIDKVVQKAVEVINAFLRSIGQQTPKIVAAGCEMIIDFINGIADAIETYTPQLMEACANLGMSVVKGVVKGMGSMGGAIWDGICDVGNSIKNGFKKVLGINSPAKEMIPIGVGIDEGIIVGLEKYKGSVVDATEDVGKTAIKSMSNAISDVSDVISSDIDSQPVIRPVLDLSNIESGAGLINGMFGMTPSVDVLSNVGSINSMMNKNQNGGDFDIISAIKDLGSKISNMGGNTYIIDGITYDDGTNVANAISDLVRAAKIERRI